MPTLNRRRNPVAQAVILRKGGVHEKSRKSKRQKQKRELRASLTKYMATNVAIFLPDVNRLYLRNSWFCF